METRSACCYCGVGCGVIINAEHGRIAGVRGDPDHPANFGRLCSKGTTLHLSTGSHGRALHPELRGERSAPRRRVGWDAALDHIAERFAACIAERGPDSVGFYISGQLLTEDYYAFNKLARAVVGTNNIDTNSRLCMSSAVAGYKATLGADAPPACYEDIDHADLLFIAGSNTAWAHPVLYRRIEDARRRNPALKTIVVDPRRTDTAGESEMHLAILPGTDVALFNGILHLLIWDERIDARFIAEHTSGFEALKKTVREYTPQMVADVCGIASEQLCEAARWFGNARNVLSLYCQGLNQSSSGTDKNAALINLHLATGTIGRPGSGPFSLTGQPNAMGGREVGGMANLLPGHREAADPGDRAEVAHLWGIDTLPARPGKTAVELFEAVHAGEVRMLWIACTNPAQSMPDQLRVREALERAELVVVQEAFATTETCAYADVLLPASTWGEKEGTVTNSERRITHVRAAIDPPGEARHDWKIAADFGRRLETRLRLAPCMDGTSRMAFGSVEEVFVEHVATTRGRDLDITGMSYTLLDRDGPQQWPLPQGASSGRARLYEDHVFATADGRARFADVTQRNVADTVDARYPLRLTTGRLRDQWHAMSRTGTVARLFNHADEPRLSMHPADAARRGLADGDVVRITSRRGSALLTLEASDTVRSGQLFAPMHWGSRYVTGTGAKAGINAITSPALDPHSRQPELKHCAVRVEHAGLHWRAVVFGIAAGGAEVELFDRARALVDDLPFASCVLFAGTRPGVLVRLAGERALPATILERFDPLFSLDAAHVLRYDDAKRGISRRVSVVDGSIVAARLGGDLHGATWLRDLLMRETPVASIGSSLLMPGAAPPSGFRSPGRIVCNCIGVAESEIRAAVDALSAGVAADASAAMTEVQATLKCGTECGSCLPEVRSLVLQRGDAKVAA
ncbi:MAG: molybdopterin-dependent oxidoreductase [Pseudomonadota bacterium]|nr:molybdopterin-dependent oxidoreductase [Pseudomonadota bacterium]